MTNVTPEDARQALANAERHQRDGVAAMWPRPAYQVGLALILFTFFAAGDIHQTAWRHGVKIGVLVLVAVVVAAELIPGLGALLGRRAMPKPWRRPDKALWLQTAVLVVLVQLDTTVANIASVRDAVRLPHVIAAALITSGSVTLWQWQLRRRRTMRSS
jgi:hypothetical protein